MGLELERDPRAQQPAPGPQADPRDWYPSHKPDKEWGGVVKIGVVLGVLVAAAVAFRIYQTDQAKVEQAKRAAAQAEERRRDQALFESQGSDCYTGKPGEYLVYTDEKGTDVVVESPANVPKRFRKEARCVYSVRSR